MLNLTDGGDRMKTDPLYNCELTELEISTLLNYLENQVDFYASSSKNSIRLSKKVPAPLVAKEEWEKGAKLYAEESKTYKQRVNYFKKILDN